MKLRLAVLGVLLLALIVIAPPQKASADVHPCWVDSCDIFTDPSGNFVECCIYHCPSGDDLVCHPI